MEITISARSDGKVPITVFHIQGKLDAGSYLQLEEKALEEHAKGARNLILDLTRASFIGSAGLRAIHTAFNLFRSGDASESDEVMTHGVRNGVFKSKHLKLVNTSSTVHQVITLSGYDMFLEIYTDLEHAVRSF